MVARWSGRGSRALALALVLTLVAPTLGLVPEGSGWLRGAEAQEFPTDGAVSGWNIQTNGPASGLNLGDWYTNSAGGNVDHYLSVTVPCGWPTAEPIHLDLYSPEVNANGPDVGDLEEIGNLSETVFGLYGPYASRSAAEVLPRPVSGAPTELVETTYAAVASGGSGPTWVRFATLDLGAADTCGTYLLRSGFTSATATDQNGWRLRVGADRAATPAAGNTLISDADGDIGTDDEILVAVYETTFQFDGVGNSCLDLYEFVVHDAASPTILLHNFDLDSASAAKTVEYFPPGGGTASPNTVSEPTRWNDSPDSTRGGDLVTTAAGDQGWWRIETCATNHNQFIQEGQSEVPAFIQQPGVPDVTATKAGPAGATLRGASLTYTIDVTNDPTATGAAVDVTVTDVLPAGVSFSSCSWGDGAGSCGESGGTVTGTRRSVHANATETLSITVTVDAGASSPIDNDATVSFTDALDNPYADVATNTVSSTIWSETGLGEVCWAASDGTDELVRFDRATGDVTVIGDLGVPNVEAIALHPTTGVLYGADAGQLGTIDLAAGTFTATTSDLSPATDVDGLAFHPFTGVLYGTQRNGGDDELYVIDPSDGSVIGTPVTIAPVAGLDDIDDLAISPIDGTAYGIANNGTGDHLVIIDLGDGSTTDLGIVELADSTQVEDIEGLSFTSDGILLASTGNTGSTADSLFTISPTTTPTPTTENLATLVGAFGTGSDYEGLACQTTDTNTISGVLFQDRDEDGVFDPGEPTRDGVTVELRRGATVLATTTTAAGGTYAFAFPATGSFDVALDATDPSFVGELVTPDTVVTVDFGTAYDQTATVDYWFRKGLISGLAWEDLDVDGLRVGADGPVTDGSVSFSLWEETNLVAGLQTGVGGDTLVGGPVAAAPDGSYAFTDLDVAGYYVEVDAGTRSITLQDEGADDTIDSDVDPATGATPLISLAAGEHRTSVDVGVWTPGALTVDVFEDNDGDGLLGAGDTGLDGVPVTLYRDTNGNGTLQAGTDALIATTPTTGGAVTFTGLAPDTYFADVDDAAVALQVPSPVRSTGAEPATVTVVSGTTANALAGYYTEIAISGRVWDDLNADGIYDATPTAEPLLSGLTVTLRDDEGGVVTTATTDGSGAYAFTGLAPGEYEVQVAAPGRVFSPRDEGGDDALDSDVDATGSTGLVAYPSGTDGTDVDAGTFARGSISGRVWHDLDADSNDEPADPSDPEPGVLGQTVRLLDGAGNPLPVGPVTTDAAGAYTFTDLDPGTYIVEVDPGTRTFSPQANDSDVDPADGRSPVQTVTSGGSVTGVDAGVYDPITLQGRLWVDDDGDATQNDGATGLAGQTITITGPGGPYTVTTGADGVWSTTSLPTDLVPGTYTIDYPVVPGHVFTPADQGGDDALDSDVDATGDATVTVLSGQTGDVDAGIYVPVSIGDRVWIDVDGDGAFGAGDTGLDGIVVELLDGTGAVDRTTTSSTVGPDVGVYEFTGLRPGTWEVRFVTAGGRVFTTPNAAGVSEALDSDADPASGRTGTFVLASGESRDDVDAGLFVPGSIGDLVWDDLDADGEYESVTEPGLEGVPLTLTGPNGFSASTTSGGVASPLGLGGYEFAGLAPGSYTLTVGATPGRALSPSGAAGGAVDSDPDVSTRQVTVVVTSGSTTAAIDVGLFATSTVGDRIWVDTDGDGVQPGSEPDLAGPSIEVALLQGGVVATRPDGSLLLTTTTSGLYSIGDVPPGSYVVRFDLPAGYVFTTGNAAAATEATDSDVVTVDGADPTIGRTGAITVDPAVTTVITDVDAGAYIPGSIAGEVWEDVDGDAVRGGSEPLAPGTTIELARTSAPAITIASVTTTDGTYSFTDLAPGSYLVRFLPPAGDALTDQGADSAPDPADGQTAPVVVTSGLDVTGVDAGVFTLVDLGDRVFEDLDGDGVQDGGEPGVATTVRLHDPADLTPGAALRTTTSDATTGLYGFTGVAPGSYVVVIEIPAGAQVTQANATTDDVDSDVTLATTDPLDPIAASPTIVLTSGGDDDSVDAGLYVPGTIGDLVWDDLDADGEYESVTEPGLEGVPLTLTGPNGFSASTTSGGVASPLGLGGYEFTGLAPGSYTLTVGATPGRALSPSGAAGGAVDSDPDVSTRQVTVVVTSGSTTAAIDVGLFATSTVGDRIWVDTDGDGVQPGSEPDLAGPSIEVALLQGGVVATRPDGSLLLTTTTSGLYSIGDVPPGSYVVRFDLPAGYVFTTGNAAAATEATDSDVVTVDGADPTIGRTGAITVDPAVTTVITDVDAGAYVLGSIAGEVWEDVDGDAVRGGSEPLAPGTTIELARTSAPATVIDSVTTTDGTYSFADLAPGSYLVRFLPPAGDALTDQGADSAPDPADGQTAPVVVTSGLDVTGVDAGVFTLVDLGDRVFEDLDGDGIQDGGEPGLATTVRLHDPADLTPGAALRTTTSDATTGLYGFTGVAPGSYVVVIEIPAGAEVTQANATTDDVDSDVTLATTDPLDPIAASPTIVLTSGGDDDSVDAGLWYPASLAGRLFDDVNDSGVDDGEAGWAAVSIQLAADHDRDGTYTPVTTTDSGVLGAYAFTGLRPGPYRITVDTSDPDLPADVVLTTGNQPLDQAVDSAEDVTGLDIGYRRPAAISGIVYDDLAGDADPTGDPVLAGVDVELRTPAGAVLATDTTDAFGAYSFDLLVPGTYEIHVDEPARYVVTTGNDPASVTLIPGDLVTVDVGYQAFAPALTVVPDGDLQVEVGPAAPVEVAHPHRITNTGNVTDTYDLTLGTSAWPTRIVEDTDGDGVLDPGETTVLSDTGPLAPGAFTDVLVVTTVPAGTPRGSSDSVTLTGTSQVGPDLPSDPPITASATDLTTVIAPVLQITKSSSLAGAPAVPGQRVTYTVTVTNLAVDANVATASGVTLDDVLSDPSHGAFDAASVTIDGTVQPDPTTLPLTLGDLAPGTTVTVTVDVVLARPLPDGTVVTDIATATSSDPQIYDDAGTPVTDVQATASDVVSSSPRPELVVTSTPVSGGLVVPGQVVTYRATISNRADATDTWRDVVYVQDLPAPNATYVPGTATVAGAPIPDGPGGTNPFDPAGPGAALGDLLPGAAVTVTLQLRVADPISDGTTLTGLGQADGSNGGPLLGVLNHTVDTRPAVTVTPDGARTVEPGTTVVYPHLLTNAGNVTDRYDLAADSDTGAVTRVVHDLDGDGVLDAGEPTITSSLQLAPGALQRLLVIVEVPAGLASGTVDTTTLVATSRTTPDVVAQAFDVTTVVAGELAIVKTASPASSAVNPGQVVTYRIEVRNDGGALVPAVTVTDDTPANSSYRPGTTRLDGVPVADRSSGDRNPLHSDGAGLALGDLAAGATRVVTFDVQVRSPVPDRSLLVNVAEASSADGQTVSDSVTQLVTASAVIDIAKTASPPPGPVGPGQVVTYTLQVRNVGNAPATAVRVTDDVPSRTTYVTGTTRVNGALVADGPAGTTPLAGSNGGLDVGRLEPGGATRTVTFDVRVDDPLPDGTIVVNEAAVTTGEGVTANSAPVRHTIRVTAGVALVPDNDVLAEVGSRAVHPHAVTNEGTGTDTIVLSATSSLGWTVTLYRDDDADGVWDLDEGTVVGSTGPLPAGASFPFFAVVDVPLTASTGVVDVLNVRAVSTTDGTVSATASDTTTVVAPQLAFVKTAVPSGDQVNPGQRLTYTVSLTNRGRAPAAEVLITDDTPTGTSYVAGSAVVGAGAPLPDGANGDGNPLSIANGGYLIDQLDPGRTVTVSFAVDVPLTATVASTIENTATARSPDGVDLTATRTHTITAGPVLDVTKTATPGTATALTAGDLITYSMSVANVGVLDATGVLLTDDTPLNARYVTGSATLNGVAIPDGTSDPNPFGSAAGGYLVGDLAAGGLPVTAGFTVEVLDSVGDGDSVRNVAGASAIEGASGTSPVVQHDIDVTPSVTLVAPQDVTSEAGATVTLAHVLTNTGDVPDNYDLGATSSRGWTVRVFEDADGDGVLGGTETEVAITPSLAPGEDYPLLLVIEVPATAPTGVRDTLTLRARSLDDPAVSARVVDTITVIEGTLSLAKAASPATVRPGTTATYTLTVSNSGSAPVIAVRLFDSAPPGTVYVPGSVTRDGVPVADLGGGNPLEAGLDLGDLGANASTVVSFQVDVIADPDRTVVINAAEAVAADIPAARAGTVQPYDTDRGLELTPGTRTEVAPGTTVSYPHTVTNTGDLDDEVVLTATSVFALPLRLVLDEDGDGIADPDEPEVAAALPLAPGESADVVAVIEVPADAPAGLEDTLQLTATSLSEPSVSVTVSDVTVVVAPVLQVVKASQPETSVEPGSVVRFGISVTNTGTDPARDVTVTDPVPIGTTYVAGSTFLDGNPVPDAVTGVSPLAAGLEIGDLAPGTSAVVLFSVRVGDDVVPGAVLTNVAEAEAVAVEPVPSNPVALSVIGTTLLQVDKTVTPEDGVRPGGTARWTIAVTNIGSIAVPEVLLTDVLAPEMRYVPGSTTVDGRVAGDGVAGGTPVSIGSLDAGATRTVTFDTTVGDVADGTVLQNAATATNGVSGTSVLSNAATVTVDALAEGLPQTGFGTGRTLSVAVVLAGTGWALLHVARPERRPRPVLLRRTR